MSAMRSGKPLSPGPPSARSVAFTDEASNHPSIHGGQGGLPHLATNDLPRSEGSDAASGGRGGGANRANSQGSTGSSAAESEFNPDDWSIRRLLIGFQEPTTSRCSRISVPERALYEVEGQQPATVGFFVKKEPSARTNGPISNGGMGMGVLGVLFSPMTSPVVPNEPKGEASKSTWPKQLQAGPYRWVPARIESDEAPAAAGVPQMKPSSSGRIPDRFGPWACQS